MLPLDYKLGLPAQGQGQTPPECPWQQTKARTLTPLPSLVVSKFTDWGFGFGNCLRYLRGKRVDHPGSLLARVVGWVDIV